MPGARSLALAALAAGAVVMMSSCAKDESKKAAAPAMTPVERGEYLVWIAGCHDCHTPGGMYGAPDMARRLSGSELGWEGPWGVSYPRNLTPDPETGIGAWRESDIVTAIRTGKRPDGTALLPPMPWPDLAHLTDEDAQAIAAYLKSIPAVSHRAPDRVAPGRKAAGAVASIPAPPPWDAPKSP